MSLWLVDHSHRFANPPRGEEAGARASICISDSNVAEAQDRLDVPEGYSWSFRPDAFDDLALFVSWERKCCPFLRFRIEVSPGHRPAPTDAGRARRYAELPGGRARVRCHERVGLIHWCHYHSHEG